MTEHSLEARIYLEDTDAQGIVYHANYLKYLERARSQLLEAKGFGLRDQVQGKLRFVVHEMTLKYKLPARLGDTVQVVSNMEQASEYRLTFEQQVRRPADDVQLLTAKVDIVCVDGSGELAALPDGIGNGPA